MKHRLVLATLVSAIALAAQPALAQWSNDPLLTLAVADGSGDQVQPKLVPTTDGGYYVSWYDNSTGGYDVRLQRLDRYGVEAWAHNGVLVADRSYSSTQDYGLAIDTAGNALIAFRDDRGGTDEITATMVTPAGAQPWGAAGVQVSAAAGAFVAAPKIAGTSDGRVVVAWTQDAEVKVVKLESNGVVYWPVVTLAPGAGSFAAADLHPGELGTAILSFIHPTGSFLSPTELWAQKFDSVFGTLLWGSGHVQVLDSTAGGSLQFGNFPTFVPDGAGGAVFAWYTNSPSLQCRAQRVTSAGAELWTHNGVEVSTNASMLRVSPSADYDPVTDETFVFWTEEAPLQNSWGVLGQKIDTAGTRQWGASGATVQPVAGNEITWVRTTALGGGEVIVAWIEAVSGSQDVLRTSRIDGAGAAVWNPALADIATSSTDKSRLAAMRSSAGFTAYAWQQGGSADIHAQAQLDDGALPAIIFANGFESGDMSMWSSAVP